MSEVKKVRLSREEIANIEIGHTEVGRSRQWALTLFFLLFITIYPVLQFCHRQPFAEWRDAGTVQQSIKAYETAIEDTSLLRQWLLTPAQRLLTGVFRTGNEKVIVGRDGWLFFAGDMEYLLNPGFLRPEKLHKRRLSGVQPDPVAAVLDFNRQLQARGIRLVLLPVPVKPMIYADRLDGKQAPLQNPSFDEFVRRMTADGVTVIDLAPRFFAMRRSGTEPYLKTDTHWTPAGMRVAAAQIAAALGVAAVPPDPDERPADSVTHLGDIAAMLKLPDCEKYFAPETVGLAGGGVHPDRNSDVLLLGDSFANIYSLGAMNWGEDRGLAETLGGMLKRPVDAILRNDAGAFATRQLLAQELKRGRDRLAGKKTVVWEFAIRELANGDWKLLDMASAGAPESRLLEISEPRTVSATVLAMTPVPRPNSAPYKDHVMSLHLGNIDGGGDQVLAYAASMVDNVWTPAAKFRIGDSVRVTLKPWPAVESQFGSWNRSEFDSEELLLAAPAWCEPQLEPMKEGAIR